MIESRTIEFKREYVDDIKYAVIAFANTDGGKLYIGMNDDGTPQGVMDIDQTLLRISNMIRDVIRPDVTMFVDYNVETIDDKQIIVVTIQRGTSRPYYLYGKGVRPEGVYIRQGASSVPASETAILKMIKETSGDCYEDARSINQQLTFEKTSRYFKQRGIDFGDAQKRTMNLISQDGTYSNLAMLLSDQCVHVIKMAVFEGSKKTVFHDRKELTGSLLEQLEDAYAYIDILNKTHAEFHGLERIDKRDYPIEALREALLNAVVHRDYAISSPTLIRIFDDRIEIVTVGGLVRGVTLEDIMLGISVLRNQHLANVFYRLKLIEAYGTGMLKIKESYADFDVKPKFEVTDNAFKITLPNTNYSQTIPNENRHVTGKSADVMATREDRIRNLCKEKGSITRKDVETVLLVSQTTAILILKNLIRRGLLKQIGKGKYIKYQLK